MVLEDCSHRPPCPGCPRFGETGPAPAAMASLRALAERTGLVPPQFHSAPAEGHRHRARLAVRGRSNSPKIGLFQLGTHEVVDIPRCQMHHPAINEVVAALKDSIRATRSAPYVEQSHRGLLRYVQVVVARADARTQVVLVVNSNELEPALPLARDLEHRLGQKLQGLFVNGNAQSTNVILGPHWWRIAGADALTESIGGVRVAFPPAAFGQSHQALAERIASRVADFVSSGDAVAELHAGVGAIGLGLLSKAGSLHFNERSEAGILGLERGLAERPEEERARASLFPGAAELRSDAFGARDVVIVDPPRGGLGDALVEALLLAAPKRLVYVACGLAAFLSESERLLAGGYRLTTLEAYDLFPFTEHVETFAVFDRAEI